MVDFANASLYLSGIQTVFSICCCAIVSVLSCWLVPEAGVSAVRTLAFCVATGVLFMRKPLRVGRAHGVRVVFSSLQPAVPIYLTTLVVEQLVHTCTTEIAHAPNWRRVVFHGMMLVMLVSGIMSSRAPLRETDMPFLITSVALVVIAMMPPPAVAFVGPLCQSVSLWEAADRLLRALAFAMVYCAHVYASTASTSLTNSETMIVVTRSASASLWTMGAHVTWLPLATVQCVIVIVARINIEQKGEYHTLSVASLSDEEYGMQQRPTHSVQKDPAAAVIDVVEQQRELLSQPTAIQLACQSVQLPHQVQQQQQLMHQQQSQPNQSQSVTEDEVLRGRMAFRDIRCADDTQPSAARLPVRASDYSHARMAEIAATIPD